MILDEGSRRLLREMQKDATLSTKELGERVMMSSTTVWRRIQEFEDAGLIKGRFTHLDPEKLGLDVCNVIEVAISEQNDEARASFENFANANDHILQCLAVTGSRDYMLITRHSSIGAFERFLMTELLAHPSVKETHSSLVLRQHKNASAIPV